MITEINMCSHCGRNIRYPRTVSSVPCPECITDGHDQIVPCSRCLFLFEEDARNSPQITIRSDPPKAA